MVGDWLEEFVGWLLFSRFLRLGVVHTASIDPVFANRCTVYLWYTPDALTVTTRIITFFSRESLQKVLVCLLNNKMTIKQSTWKTNCC